MFFLEGEFLRTSTMGPIRKVLSLPVFFFFTREKKNHPEKIFTILPEKYSKWLRKKKRKLPEKKKSDREKK